MTSIEANENVPETPAPQQIGDFRAFLRDEVGTLTVILFTLLELGTIIRFLRRPGAASGWDIEHFIITLLAPTMLLTSTFLGYRRVKRALTMSDSDPTHFDAIMDVFRLMVMTAFLGMMMLTMP